MNPLARLMDLIYPPRCRICDVFLDEPGAFCATCFAGFERLESPLCVICGIPFSARSGGDHVCEHCLRRPPPFEALRAPFLYQGRMREAVHRFKYGGQSDLGAPLGDLLADLAEGWLSGCEPLLVPVPLHPGKLRKRGFNQSLLLARQVARRLGAPLDYLTLRRVRPTESQSGLLRADRQGNVRGAFRLARKLSPSDRPVLLVDDVATTGHTLKECARVLRGAGARRVLCLALARTPADPARPRFEEA